jgi:short-subunit dehydrogenase
MPFENRDVLITGGAGEIGGLLTQELVRRGARVTVLDRQPPRDERTPFVCCDLSTPEGLDAACEAASRLPCDILVNLAGVQHFGPVETQAPEDLERTFSVNLLAPVRLTQAVLPAMRAQWDGQIVNVGSIFGSINFAHFATYSSSKAGLRGFSQALRRELVGSGVHVTYFAPRAVRTAFNTARVLEFASITGMAMDAPEKVAARMADAIARRRGDVYLGFPEALFVRLNALAPALVDRALAASDRRVAKLFA